MIKISGESTIAAKQDVVWKALNDTETLRQSIPGCEQFEEIAENEYKATIITRIGPVKAKFNGSIKLADFDPPNGYTLSGAGSAGSMGNAKVKARVTLTPIDEGTLLNYEVDAEMTGKIAQLGARLIKSTAGILAGQFFKRFGTLVAGPTQTAKPGGGLSRWILIAAGAIILIILATYFLWI
jgi:uncharacterized protein